MADEKKPSINLTRGGKKPPRTAASDRPAKRSESGSSGLGVLPTGLSRSVRDVWLAGLGALDVVEEQGMRFFYALVEEGEQWERTRREEAEEAMKQAAAEADRAAEAASEAADEQVVRRIRESVDAALVQAGVPTRSALEGLQRQVDALAQKADRLARQLDETGGSAGR